MNWIQYRLADVLGGGVEEPDTDGRQAKPHETADDRQQRALDQQLADDAPARRAQRDADGHFARAAGRSREQQVRDVGAGDQEYEADRAHQRQEHQLDRPAVHAIVERHDARADVLVGIGIIASQFSRDGVHLCLRLRHRDAVAQPAEDIQGRAGIALLFQELRRVRERHPQVGAGGKLEAFRHHADHRCWQLVDLDGAAENGRITAVAVLPHAVSQDDHGRRARPIVLRKEIAADQRLLANQLEGVGRLVRALEALGRASFVADVHGLATGRRQARERPRRGAPVHEILIRHAPIASAPVPRADDDDSIRVVEWQAADQDGVDEREHGGVHPDSERQRDHGDAREPAVFDQKAYGELHVLQQVHGTSFPGDRRGQARVFPVLRAGRFRG